MLGQNFIKKTVTFYTILLTFTKTEKASLPFTFLCAIKLFFSSLTKTSQTTERKRSSIIDCLSILRYFKRYRKRHKFPLRTDTQVLTILETGNIIISEAQTIFWICFYCFSLLHYLIRTPWDAEKEKLSYTNIDIEIFWVGEVMYLPACPPCVNFGYFFVKSLPHLEFEMTLC